MVKLKKGIKVALIRKSDRKKIASSVTLESMGMTTISFTFSKTMLDELQEGDSLYIVRDKDEK